MVALAQDGRDRASLEISWACVEGRLETAAGTFGKCLLTERLRRSDDAGDETGGCLDHGHRGDFAAAENVVSDGQLVADLVARTLVDALVTTADEQD